MKRHPDKIAKKRAGATLVEMAFVLPVFLTISYGIIEFGRGMMISNMVTTAAREGTRQAVLDGSTNTHVEQTVKSFLTASTGVSASDVSVSISIAAAAGNPSPGGQVGSAQARDSITVQVQIPYSKVALISGGYLKNVTLTGRSTMRHE